MVLLSKSVYQTLMILLGLVLIGAVVLLITLNGFTFLMELSDSTIISNPVQ